jgi:hypothetical protein
LAECRTRVRTTAGGEQGSTSSSSSSSSSSMASDWNRLLVGGVVDSVDDGLLLAFRLLVTVCHWSSVIGETPLPWTMTETGGR